ncbi:phospholipase D-like domain-containing protein [Nocardioides sp. YIM 152315]|uniref:phospholipase D-like domain-containing protein n=1 Tax=Nocardioides sp. YIM 152315 TaxID=3031760 RepID=UPI0023DAB652|nr:phospholipase D-like domain-containing protein [Nocardioides sp. YIM 152315]MDF1603660.1 phospholipase D-like domain-containing protein [Nocardioides sp. YIM 152315]
MKSSARALATALSLIVLATAGSGSVGTPAAAAPTVAAHAAKPKKPKWTPAEGPVFNVPRSRPETQFRIERQVLSAIRHSKKGSRIWMSMFSFDRFPVADALIKARKRGVQVQVLINDHEMTPAQRKMRKAVGTNRKKKNFVAQCYKGCRSNGDVLHSKFILFSKTGAARDVVMVGSVNMKMNGAKNQYNDLWTTNDSTRLYERLEALFKEMKLDKPVRKPYIDEQIGKYRLMETPFHGAPYDDPIMTLLRPVQCKGAKRNGGRTVIRVNMHAWDGSRGRYIAQRFRNLYAQGCDVKIQYGMAGRNVREVFGNPTKRGYVPVRSNGFDTDHSGPDGESDGEIDLYSHMKELLISGHYGDRTNARISITGSSNYQDSGLTGDEMVLMIPGRKTYKAYLRHWNWMWDHRTRAVGYRPHSGSADDTDPPFPARLMMSMAALAPSGDLPRMIVTEKYGFDSPEWRDE